MKSNARNSNNGSMQKTLAVGLIFAVLCIFAAGAGLSGYKDLLKPIESESNASSFTTMMYSATNAIIGEKTSSTKQEITAKAVTEPITIHSAFLKYGNDLQANTIDVKFSANFTLSSDGEACFQFLVPDASTDKCPFPYIRLRLSGAALMNVPIRQQEGRNLTQMNGCSMLPVPGSYFVDANLVHCRANGRIRKMESKTYKASLAIPVWPDLKVRFEPHKFELPPFVRERRLYYGIHNNQTNAYPYHAWLFAPTCKGSKYQVAEQCSQDVDSPFVATKFQFPEFLEQHHLAKDSWKGPEIHTRFDNYMWLPFDPSTGAIDYEAEHFGLEYSPTPKFLQESKSGIHNQTMLFIGASHSRYLANQASQLYYNLTYGIDGCAENKAFVLDLAKSRFERMYLKFADEWTAASGKALEQYKSYDKYIVTIGHWDAGFPRDRPTPPGDLLEGILTVIGMLEEFVKPGAEIFVVSVNQHPLGEKMLTGKDWRVPPIIDAYNNEIRSQVDVHYPITGTRSFRFRDFNRTFFLDNTDVLDPIWDSATDFYHPCRYASRPTALRVLDLLKE